MVSTASTPRRHFLSYSLRTLFVLLTALGIVGGWYASRYHTAQRRYEAIQWMQDRQIHIEFSERPYAPGVLAPPGKRFPGKDEVVTVVSVSGWRVRDDEMAAIGNFPELKSLTIMSGAVTDKGLEHLGNLTALEHLGLHGLPISDAGLRPLRSLRGLKWIELCSDGISDAGLAHLKGLAELRGLGLNRTQVSDAGLAQLHGLTQLHLVDLTGTDVTKAGVRELQLALPNCVIVR
jgi:hypothetical protein